MSVTQLFLYIVLVYLGTGLVIALRCHHFFMNASLPQLLSMHGVELAIGVLAARAHIAQKNIALRTLMHLRALARTTFCWGLTLIEYGVEAFKSWREKRTGF